MSEAGNQHPVRLNSHKLGAEPTDTIPAHLLADISNHDARLERKRFGVPKLHDERLDAMFLAVDDQLGENSTVRGRLSGASDPPLGGADVWGVNDKLVSRAIECRRRLQAGNVGAVRKFYASDQLNPLASWPPNDSNRWIAQLTRHTKATNHALQRQNPLLNPVIELSRRGT